MPISLPSILRSPAKTEANEFLRMVQGSRARKDESQRRISYYNDEQAAHAAELIARRFGNAEHFRIFQLNIVRRIVRALATTYKSPPRRVFDGWNQQEGEDLYRSLNADAVLKQASRLTKLLKTNALRVAWNDGPRLYLHTPAILDAIAPDPERPERVIVTTPHENPERVTYADWTADTFTMRDARGNIIPTAGNPDRVNPYGILPFVPLFDSLPDGQFFLPGGADLFDAQDAITVAAANLWRSIETQAHGQAVATGVAPNTPLETGPHRAILLPEGGSFSYAAPNSPIAEILKAVEFVMRQVAATNSVDSHVFDLSKSAVSGSAQAAQRIDLRESRADDVALARIAESRLFQTLKRVVNTHKPGTIPEAASIRIDFADLDREESTEAETLANAKSKSELGVYSPVDVLMELNPDGYANRDEAFQELMRRKDETSDLQNLTI